MSATAARIVWIQRLDLWEALRLPFLALRRPLEVLYDEAQAEPAALRLTEALRRLGLGPRIGPWRVVGDRQDASGRTLYYRMHEIMEVCLKRFHRQTLPGQPAWLAQTVCTYLPEQPFQMLAHVEAEAAARPAAEHEVRLAHFPANDVLVRHWTQPGLLLRSQFTPQERLKALLLPFVYVLRALLRQLRSGAPATDIRTIRPAIWVEWGGHGSWLAFWREELKAEGFDLVYCFDLARMPPDDTAQKLCSEQGMRWIDNRQDRLARLAWRDLRDIALVFLARRPGEPWWLRCFRTTFETQVRLASSVFERFQVKAYIQHHDTVWKPQAQLLALERAGGIMVGFHWSSLPFVQPFYMSLGHVYFVWGKHMRDFQDRKGHANRHILPCGLWLREDTMPGKIPDLPARPSFILALMDNSVVDRTYHRPASLSRFYRSMLSLLEENPTWGAYAKPKNLTLEDLARLPEGGNIVGRIRRLEAAGRMLYLPLGLTPPAASAKAALTVCYGLQTAGILAGAHGRRVVMWDVPGWLDDALYRDPHQRILFASLTQLEDAVRAAGRGDAAVGDFSRWRKAFDHFEDDRAKRRVADFLRNYMSQVQARGALPALDEAARCYRADNRVEADFEADNIYWPGPPPAA